MREFTKDVHRLGDNLHNNIQVTIRPPIQSRVAVPFTSQARAILDPGR